MAEILQMSYKSERRESQSLTDPHVTFYLFSSESHRRRRLKGKSLCRNSRLVTRQENGFLCPLMRVDLLSCGFQESPQENCEQQGTGHRNTTAPIRHSYTSSFELIYNQRSGFLQNQTDVSWCFCSEKHIICGGVLSDVNVCLL